MSSFNYYQSIKYKKINCDSCDKFFYDILEYNNHLSTFHFICPLCNDNYKHDNELSLFKHSWKHHSSSFTYFNTLELFYNNLK